MSSKLKRQSKEIMAYESVENKSLLGYRNFNRSPIVIPLQATQLCLFFKVQPHGNLTRDHHSYSEVVNQEVVLQGKTIDNLQQFKVAYECGQKTELEFKEAQ